MSVGQIGKSDTLTRILEWPAAVHFFFFVVLMSATTAVAVAKNPKQRSFNPPNSLVATGTFAHGDAVKDPAKKRKLATAFTGLFTLADVAVPTDADAAAVPASSSGADNKERGDSPAFAVRSFFGADESPAYIRRSLERLNRVKWVRSSIFSRHFAWLSSEHKARVRGALLRVFFDLAKTGNAPMTVDEIRPMLEYNMTREECVHAWALMAVETGVPALYVHARRLAFLRLAFPNLNSAGQPIQAYTDSPSRVHADEQFSLDELVLLLDYIGAGDSRKFFGLMALSIIVRHWAGPHECAVFVNRAFGHYAKSDDVDRFWTAVATQMDDCDD